MKKLRISCLIVFLAGVLVAGAGLSLMFLEASAFRYGGDKLIEGQSSDIKTYRKTVDLSALDELRVSEDGTLPHYSYRDADLLLVTDAAAGDDAIIEVRYNSVFYEPWVDVERVYEGGEDGGVSDGDGDEYDGEDGEGESDGQADGASDHPPAPQPRRAALGFYVSRYNDFAEMMTLKEVVLQDIKQRTFYSYDVKKVYEVKITVSPENVGKITGVTRG